MKSLANQANKRLIITTFYFYYTNASQKCLQKYEIDLGSGQNHTDTVSLDLSKAPLNFRNILKLPLLLKSHDWCFDTRSKQMIHKAVFQEQTSLVPTTKETLNISENLKSVISRPRKGYILLQKCNYIFYK